jgi:hypothetical protein
MQKDINDFCILTTIMTSSYESQNALLLIKLKEFYSDYETVDKMLKVITGESKISLRIVDWFVTNYAKKYYVILDNELGERFKVHNEYKLKLDANSKRRFDPFCRRERTNLPYKDGTHIETTIGQLNFFKWVLENNIIPYIEEHYSDIEADMNSRNSTAKIKTVISNNKTRKRREELSVSATKSIKKEYIEIKIKFS